MKNNFGKGLESLIPKKSQKPEKEKKEAVFFIEIEKITANPYQPRKEFDREGLKTLSDSIKEYGILQPLVVSRSGSEGRTEYQLIAGERRYLASKMAGLSQVPVIIKDPTDREKLEVSLIENAQRLDLNPIEKAEAFSRLNEEFGIFQKDIARICGVSREAVANTMRLLELPGEVREAVKNKTISEGHARALLALKSAEKQKTVFIKTVREGLSVRGTEELVKKTEIWKPLLKRKDNFPFGDLEEKFKKILSLKNLKIKSEGGRPKLTILFNSKEELEKVLKNLNS
jgi:ParB family transcriptional regulator, chromosome partitioning protein